MPLQSQFCPSHRVFINSALFLSEFYEHPILRIMCIVAFFIEDVTYSEDGYDGRKANKYNTFSTIRFLYSDVSESKLQCFTTVDEFRVQLYDLYVSKQGVQR